MDFYPLAQRFNQPSVKALVLMGSHARGDAGPYSDVDLVRFVAELLGPALQPEQAPLIAATIQLINREIENAYHGEQ